MSEDKSIAGHFVIGDGLQQGGVIEPKDTTGASKYAWLDVLFNDELQQATRAHRIEFMRNETLRLKKANEKLEHPAIESTPFMSELDLRAYVTNIVRQVLEEDAREIATNPAFQPINAHQHRRVEMTDENGLHWRGVLYATNAEPLFTPLSGVCWGCLKPGTDMQWYSRDGRSHLIHKSEECRKLAAEKQESKEHRG